jgi:hypothetical protein
MIIESKPLLILQKSAFTALIKVLDLERKHLPLKCEADLKRIEGINTDISKSVIMLDAINNELQNKHSND